MKRFHKKALDCRDPVAEDMLVEVCLQGMIENYMIFSENLSFPFLLLLMETARRTNVTKTLKSSLTIWYVSKKRPVIQIVEKGKSDKGCSSKNPIQQKQRRQFAILPPFSCEAKKDTALVEQCINNNSFTFQKWNLFLLQLIWRIDIVFFSQKERTFTRVGCHFRKFLMRSTKQEKFCSKKELSMSTTSISEAK